LSADLQLEGDHLSTKHELPVPPGARSDKGSKEVVRAWIANGGLHCSLDVGIFGDTEAIGWGILLSDIVRHVANARNEQHGIEIEETIQEIRKTLNAELSAPSADANGSFV
jgi:hypothetical protein